MRESLFSGWAWVEAGSIGLQGLGPVKFLYKRFGLKGLAAMMLIVGSPVGEYSMLRYMVQSSIPRLFGDFGLTIEARDWSYNPITLKTVARNLRVVSADNPNAAPIFTAAEVELRGSLTSALAGVWELVRFRPFHTFNAIAIRHAEIHLERSLGGTLNWTELLASVPVDRKREVRDGLYRINKVTFEDVRLKYVEHVPGASGSGVIQTAQAAIHVDGIEGVVNDIGSSVSTDEELPTHISLTGRAADGLLEIKGGLALGAGGDQVPASSPQSQSASLGAVPQAETRGSRGPRYDINVTLNDIGASALFRALPPTRIVPTSGTVRGTLRFHHNQPYCTSKTAISDVRFAPNPQVVLVRSEYESLRRALEDSTPVSKIFEACQPFTNPPPDRRPSAPNGAQPAWGGALAFAAAFNEQATADAPPVVRAAVSRDSRVLVGSLADSMFGEANPGGSGNPLARGFRGLKRLFGSD